MAKMAHEHKFICIARHCVMKTKWENYFQASDIARYSRKSNRIGAVWRVWANNAFFCGATSTDDYRLLVEHNFLVSQLLRRCRRNIFCSLSIFIDWLRLCVRFFNTFFVSRNISIYNFPSKSMVYLTNRHLYSFVLIKLIQIQKCSTHEIHIFCGSVHLTSETHWQPWMKTCRCILCMKWRVR